MSDCVAYLFICINYYTVTVTLLNFVKLFRKAHEENCKQAEMEKKKAEKEAEVKKAKSVSHAKRSQNI